MLFTGCVCSLIHMTWLLPPLAFLAHPLRHLLSPHPMTASQPFSWSFDNICLCWPQPSCWTVLFLCLLWYLTFLFPLSPSDCTVILFFFFLRKLCPSLRVGFPLGLSWAFSFPRCSLRVSHSSVWSLSLPFMHWRFLHLNPQTSRPNYQLLHGQCSPGITHPNVTWSELDASPQLLCFVFPFCCPSDWHHCLPRWSSCLPRLSSRTSEQQSWLLPVKTRTFKWSHILETISSMT